MTEAWRLGHSAVIWIKSLQMEKGTESDSHSLATHTDYGYMAAST